MFDPLVLLEDEPVPSHAVDDLGLIPFAKVVAGTAVGTTGPFTVGVFGEWGHGKTSVLRQAKSLIDEDHPEVVTVWFNAWQFEREAHPIVPLLATIVQAIEGKLRESGTAVQKHREALTSVSRALRAIAYGFSTKASFKVPGFAELETGFVAKEMIDRYDKLQTPADPLLERSLYYNAFELLSHVRTSRSTGSTTHAKIVVLIDDLDRCLPPQSLRLIEGVKLVLGQPGFIFVLGVDRRILESYLERRYERDFGVEDYVASGAAYLDKIVQLPLGLPPHRSRFNSYIRRLLERDAFNSESNRPVKEALEQLVEILAIGSDYNPRSVVRFVNNLIIDRSIWAAMGEEVDAQLLAMCAVSRILRQHLGEALYRHLVGSNSLCSGLLENGGVRNGSLEADVSRASQGSDRMLNGLRVRLDRSPFLRHLLQTDAGTRWLVDHNARARVNEFLVEQRTAQESTAVTPAQELIARAEVFANYDLQDEALKTLSEAVVTHPDDVEAITLLINQLLEGGDHVQVLQLAKRAADLCRAQGRPGHWRMIQKLLKHEGYVVSGTRVLSAPPIKLKAAESPKSDRHRPRSKRTRSP